MGGLFKNLQQKIDERSDEGGISPIDIASLPPAMRKIMRLMLREIELTYPNLCQVMAEMSERDRLSQADLDEALATLTKQQWLIRMGEADLVTYKVNLRRKAGSSLGGGIWAKLTDRLETRPEPPPEEASGTAAPAE